MIDREAAHVFGRLSAGSDITLHSQPDGILFNVIGELSRLAADRQALFTNSADLLSTEGLAEARQQQGILKGLEMAINFIMELGYDRDEPTELS